MSNRTTITLDPKLLLWARRRAADENISLSKLIARFLAREMPDTDAYWRAYEEWKRFPRDLGVPVDASKRMTRDEVHERR